jgi:hypothetical protein
MSAAWDGQGAEPLDESGVSWAHDGAAVPAASEVTRTDAVNEDDERVAIRLEATLARLASPDLGIDDVYAIASEVHGAVLAEKRAREHAAAQAADEEKMRRLRRRLAAGDIAVAHELLSTIEAKKRREAPPPETTCFGLDDALDPRLPPTDWICESLHLCPGRPAMFIGYAGSGKTYAAIALLLALVFQREVWGHQDFEPSRGRKLRGLWVDFELGPKASKKILRKLTRGMKIDRARISVVRAELGHEPVEVERSTDLRLGPGRYEQLEAALAVFTAKWIARLRGFDVVVIDSLRRLAPFLNEKEPEMGSVIDALRAASEATGCVIILLHHAVKMGGSIAASSGAPRKGARPVRPVEEMGSGSGAIDAGAGAQFFFQKDGTARLVTQGRASVEADRPMCEPFYLAMLDTGGPGGPGVEIVHRTKDQIYPPKAKATGADEAAAREALILETVKANPGKSVNVLGLLLQKDGKGMRPETLAALVSGMVGLGSLVNAGTTHGSAPSKAGAKLYLPGTVPAPSAPPAPAQVLPATPKRARKPRKK